MSRLVRACSAVTLLGCLAGSPAFAELQLSGDIAITLRGLDQHTRINENFRGDDPFNSIRARLFARKWVSDDVGFFTEFLVDRDAEPRLNGAYVVINNVVQDTLDLKVGRIPSPFGNFGLRSTYFNSNPVIGVPLMWQHKTGMIRTPEFDAAGALVDLNAFLLRRRDGQAGGRGRTPIAYDACWEDGLELSGRQGHVEYAVALTLGALSNPVGAADNDGYQTVVRLGFNNDRGMRVGVSAALSPYLSQGDHALLDLESYRQRSLGWYGEYLVGKVEVFSEWVHTTWEAPGLAEQQLSAHSGYVDFRWNARPDIYVGVRTDYMAFSSIRDTRGTAARSTSWDVPLQRIEPAVGWRFHREGLIKLVYQKTWFDADHRPAVGLLALQLHIVF